MAPRRFFSSGEKRGQAVAFRRQHPDQPVDAVSLKTLVRLKAGIVAPALKAVERKGA